MPELFEHNRIAYENAVEMLSELGKAAIIHPTGTGKSFIGFRLCEDNPEALVCWLSPSSYIYRTQQDNWANCGGGALGNIRFYTYSKLMGLELSEIESIKPDYIILDEFHRCGAEMWGQGVQRLLSAFPDCPVLGLSATNVRYLDNCRDMADELFDGNIASEMTLGEAVVRGILTPPKYVLTVFSYQEELERYKSRVMRSQSPWARDEAQRYLDALQRTLENAEGLDAVFDRHMTRRTGKYIVFCANFDHMRTMISASRDWFSRVDREPRIYSVYSFDPYASKAFADFRADNDSSHLRLLFCIDALNEGIHLDDISGVILLRPTVSPIIYKQQIGRAMSASSTEGGVIFDIVDNISGLYSIDALREEMDTAIENLRYLGEDGVVVNDTFQVFDEVRECRELFDRLEHTLSASWEQMFAMAKAYYEENGDLLPCFSYTTPEGYHLGQWIQSQRISYNKKCSSLTEERIRRLESVGMCWDTRLDRLWNESFEIVRAYSEKHGTLEGLKSSSQRAYSWLLLQRQKFRSSQLSSDRISRLNSVGMVWEIEDGWKLRFEQAREYYLLHGDLDIPATYVTESGIQLGMWYRGVLNSYKAGVLPEERIRQLEEIGINWVSVKTRTWMSYYEKLREYYIANGNSNIASDYVADDGRRLGVWASSQRCAHAENRLTQEQRRLLDEIEFSWQRDDSRWETGYGLAEDYFGRYGGLNVPIDYKTQDGYALGKWIAAQRTRKKQNKLSEERIEKLDAIGMCWSPSDAMWNVGYEHAREYFNQHGDLLVSNDFVTSDGFRLGIWLDTKRTAYKRSTLQEERIAELERIGMLWNPLSVKWQSGFMHADAFYRVNRHLNVQQKYVSDDGYNLGSWISAQRRSYRKDKLSADQIQKLEGIEMIWSQYSAVPDRRVCAETRRIESVTAEPEANDRKEMCV